MNYQKEAQKQRKDQNKTPDFMNSKPQKSSESHKNIELSIQLKNLVRQYIDSSSIRSVAFLARKAQLPYTTVRRAYNADGIPDLETVISLLDVILKKDQIMEFINKYFTEHYKIIDGTFSTTIDENYSHLDHYPYDEISNHILHLCSTSIGSNSAHIKSLFGAIGIKKLDTLIKNGFIQQQQNDTLKVTQNHNIPAEKSLKNFEVFSRIFDLDNLGTDAGLLCLVSETINDQGLAKIKNIGQEYIKRAQIIRKKQTGKIPFYIGIMQNLYDYQPNQDINFKNIEIAQKAIRKAINSQLIANKPHNH